MPSNTEILYRLGLGITLLVYQRLMITKDVKKVKQFDAMNLNKENYLKS